MDDIEEPVGAKDDCDLDEFLAAEIAAIPWVAQAERICPDDLAAGGNGGGTWALRHQTRSKSIKENPSERSAESIREKSGWPL